MSKVRLAPKGSIASILALLRSATQSGPHRRGRGSDLILVDHRTNPPSWGVGGRAGGAQLRRDLGRRWLGVVADRSDRGNGLGQENVVAEGDRPHPDVFAVRAGILLVEPDGVQCL